MNTHTSKSLFGIIPALITPFDDQGRFSTDQFEKLLGRLYEAEIDGVYLCGSTGEGLAQSSSQREEVVELAKRLSPKDRQIIVHVGAYSTAEAIRLARHASKLDVAAISSIAPMGGKYSFAEVRQYYRDLAACCDLPLLLYYFPEIAPVVSSVDQILELCEIPNVVGTKFTDFDLFTMKQVKQSGNTVLYGRDEMLTAGLLFGADGGIGTFYNVLPEMFVRLWRLSNLGAWQEMLPLQEQINEFIRITLRFPLFPAVKEILRWTGIEAGPCLPPRQHHLSDAQVTDLRNELESKGFLDLLALSTPA